MFALGPIEIFLILLVGGTLVAVPVAVAVAVAVLKKNRDQR